MPNITTNSAPTANATTTATGGSVVAKADTLIAFVLDHSGSMSSVKSQATESTNLFIREQKAAKGNAKFNLTTFNDSIVEECHWVDVKDMRFLGSAFMSPNGGTHLHDAIIEVCGSTESRWAVDGKAPKVIITVLTDGQENGSLHTKDDVQAEIAAKIALGWEFIFLAPDAWSAKWATAIGFQHVLQWDTKKPETMQRAIAATTHAIAEARETGVLSLEHKESVIKL